MTFRKPERVTDRVDHDIRRTSTQVDAMSKLEVLAAVLRAHSASGESTRSPRRAPARMRFGAAVIDLAIGLVIAIFVAIFPIMGGWKLGGAMVWSAVLLYSTLEILPGDSPGKWMVGLTITLPNGRPASRGRLVLRWLIKYSFLFAGGLYAMIDSFAMVFLPWPAVLPYLDALNLAMTISQIIFWFAALLILAGMLGTFVPARRALHDWFAGTAVYLYKDLLRDPPSAGRAFEVQAPQAPADHPLT
jgi:uncharacterized RDD family membrane protein YckC